MRHLITAILIVILAAGIWHLTEKFETVEPQIQNRYNPLASLANPLQNPAAPVGLSDSKSAMLRKVTGAALTPVESFAAANSSWSLLK